MGGEIWSLPREPFSAWSHLVWLLIALPMTWRLWRLACGNRPKQISLLIFGFGLIACATGSTLYHTARVSGDRLEFFVRMDHIGIYLLIAGTITPIAWNLMGGRWRRGVLTITWLFAFGGAFMHASSVRVPPYLPTLLYLAMGWGTVLCYGELSKTFSLRELSPVARGGVYYSVGAILNLAQWPKLWPGVFQAHELFHLFVIAGSLAHYSFMVRIVVPWNPRNFPDAGERLKERRPSADVMDTSS